MNKLCQFCPKPAQQLVVIFKQPFFCCAEHTEKLESFFGDFEPLTTTFYPIITYSIEFKENF